MVRQVQAFVPDEHVATVRTRLAEMEHVHHVTEITGVGHSLFSLKCTEKRMQSCLAQLSECGVGKEFGSVDVLQLMTTKPAIVSLAKKKRLYKLTDRMSVEEIFEFVDAQSHLTFDYLAMIVAASMLAAVGLVSDSSVTVVASMLVSPLMGPIICVTFGLSIRSKRMVRRGLRNELAGMLLTVLIGMLAGICVAPFYGGGGVQESWSDTVLRSEQIEERGQPWGLISGFFVAVPSGAAVALATTGGGANALVGVAIAAALLPPCVNSGLCLTLGLFYKWEDVQWEADHFLSIAGISFLLFLINIVVIVLVALYVFHIKRVRPINMTTMHGERLVSVDYDAKRKSLGTLGVDVPVHMV